MINNSAKKRGNDDLNNITLIGAATGNAEFSHSAGLRTADGDKAINFLRFTLEVPRLSGVSDFLQVIVRKEMWDVITNQTGTDCDNGAPRALLEISGRVQSYNRMDSETGKNSLELFVFAKSIRVFRAAEEAVVGAGHNSALFEGYICKEPIVRETPLGRTIADLFVAVNRSYGASYIPIIVWGGNAISAYNLHIGDKVLFEGRFQSRKYVKDINGEMIPHTAYEISASTYKVLEK